MDSQIIVGDCIDSLKSLPERSVQCCVTSPPYWGLRNYGIPPRQWSDGTVSVFGLESTPELFVAHSVEIFREVRRVLRDDGTLWLNLGDSYNQDSKWGGSSSNKNETKQGYARKRTKERNSGNKPGDICNVPHRVAAALQADGWYWRSTIIWAKRSPMPESISGWRWVRCRVKIGPSAREHKGHSRLQGARDEIDGKSFASHAKWSACPGCPKCEPNGSLVLRRGKWRPTNGHEYVFLLSKSERYFCDGDAVQEAAVGGTPGNKRHKGADAYANGDKHMRTKVGLVDVGARETRNPRSVWTLSNEPFRGAHFATYPTEIPRRAITAGTSSAGCCASCGMCYAPIVSTERMATRPGQNNKIWKHETADSITQRSPTSPNLAPYRHVAVTAVTGYRPSCGCNVGEPVPCVVLDPFGGSGTTGQVANALGRRYVLIEVNPDYVELIKQRVNTPLRKNTNVKGKKRRKAISQLELFDS